VFPSRGTFILFISRENQKRSERRKKVLFLLNGALAELSVPGRADDEWVAAYYHRSVAM